MTRTYRKHPYFRRASASSYAAIDKENGFNAVSDRIEWYKDTGLTDHRAGSGYGLVTGFHFVLHVRKGETEESIRRQFHKYPAAPCPCCFRHEGRIWELRGSGKKLHKSMSKSKGMRREGRRDSVDMFTNC